MPEEQKHWTLDKRVPLSLILVLVVYLVAGIWSYSTLITTVKHNHQMMIIATKTLNDKLTEKTVNILNNLQYNQKLMKASSTSLENKINAKTVDRFHKTEALEHIRVLQIQITNNNDENIKTNRRLEKCTESINNKLDRLIEKNNEIYDR